MSSSALRAAWEAAQRPADDASALRAAWEAAQTPAKGHDYHSEYASGALAKRMQGANAREAANLKDEEASQPGYLERLATHVLNTAQGIPGVEAVERGAGALGSQLTGQPMGDDESLATLREATGKIPTALRVGERIGGAALAAPAMTSAIPASLATPAKTGAVLGGLDQALSADKMSLGGRAARTVGGAAAGGLLGKALSMARTAIGAKAPVIGAEEPTANLVERGLERKAASGPLYKEFRDLGDLGSTPKLDEILDLPIVRRAVETVKGESPTLAKLPDTDARVLDAVYKRVGSRAFSAAHGFEPGEARAGLAEAIEEAANAKGGSYQKALSTFKGHSQGMEGVQRGRDALNSALSKSGGGQKAALTKSPAALAADFPSMTRGAQQGVREGLYGQLGRNNLTARAFKVPLPLPSAALMKGDALANQFDPGSTDIVRQLLASLNGAVANPK